MTFKRILVPLDGSTLAEQALAPAIKIAQHVQGELIVMRVPVYVDARVQTAVAYDMAPVAAMWPQESITPVYEEAQEYLAHIVERRKPADLPMRALVVDGDRAGAIVDTAVSEKADLIVMSTHGRTGLSRWVFGSVTERVLRGADCAALIVRTPQPLRHILVTLDGSRLAERALAPALTLARAFESKVTLLRVSEPIEIDPEIIEQIGQAEWGLGEQLSSAPLRNEETYLQNLAAPQQHSGLDVQTAVVSGPVAAAILDFSEAQKVDLIAMSTHGRSGLRRWVYGSITEKVMRGARCAMLITRPPGNALR
jgi:nucleotide-binding universal stress UspA family protein